MDGLKRRPLHPSKSHTDAARSPRKSKSPPQADEMEVSEELEDENSSSEMSSPSQGIYPNIDDDLLEIRSSTRSTSKSSMSDKDTSFTDKEEKWQNSKGNQKESNAGQYFIYMIIAVAIFFAGMFGYNIFSRSQEKELSNTAKVMHMLKADFAHQLNFSMKSIGTSLKNVINSDTNPKKPAIILFVSSEGAEKTTECLTHKLANQVLHETSANEIGLVDAGMLTAKDPAKMKKNIDDAIERSVTQNALNIFLVKNIDAIPGTAAMIMHKYCDHENAPYRRAVIMMTISAEQKIPKNVDIKEMNNIARARLNQTWTDLKSDQFEPLYTRISGFISPIFQEPKLPNCKL